MLTVDVDSVIENETADESLKRKYLLYEDR